MISTTTSRSRPGLVSALTAQFLLLLRSTRPLLLLAVVATVWVVATYYLVETGSEWPAIRMTSPEWLTLMFVMGALWGMQLWQDEGPPRRTHHWRLPVDRTVHDILRVAAGVLWLCLAVTAFLLCAAAVLAVHGELAVALGVNPLLWLNFFTAALLGFLLMSAFTTLFTRGFEWAVLAVITLTALMATGGEGSPRWLESLAGLVRALWTGEYGLAVAVGGMAPLGRMQLDGSAPAMAAPAGPGAWLLAATIWLVASGMAVSGAALWHRRR